MGDGLWMTLVVFLSLFGVGLMFLCLWLLLEAWPGVRSNPTVFNVVSFCAQVTAFVFFAVLFAVWLGVF